MYFWRIEELKAAMAVRPLSEREVLPYLAVAAGLSAVAVWIPEVTMNFWDGAGMVWSIAVAVLGTLHIYQQNGGAGGEHLLQRCLAIGWVVSLRWLVAIVLFAVAFFAATAAFGTVPEHTTWVDFLMIAAFQVGLYWRIGHHVRDVARRTGTAQGPAAAEASDPGSASGPNLGALGR